MNIPSTKTLVTVLFMLLVVIVTLVLVATAHAAQQPQPEPYPQPAQAPINPLAGLQPESVTVYGPDYTLTVTWSVMEYRVDYCGPDFINSGDVYFLGPDWVTRFWPLKYKGDSNIGCQIWITDPYFIAWAGAGTYSSHNGFLHTLWYDIPIPNLRREFGALFIFLAWLSR